jgi:hypothetical protein
LTCSISRGLQPPSGSDECKIDWIDLNCEHANECISVRGVECRDCMSDH